MLTGTDSSVLGRIGQKIVVLALGAAFGLTSVGCQSTQSLSGSRRNWLDRDAGCNSERCRDDDRDRSRSRDPGRCSDGSCSPQTVSRIPCSNCDGEGCRNCDFELPRELKKVSLPDYTVEPPDILLIEVSGGHRLSTDALRSGELLQIRVANTIPIDAYDDEVSRQFKQINGTFQIQTDGSIDFGPEYGAVRVRGMTIEEARRLIELSLKQVLKNPQVFLQRASEQADQQISGEHLVRPDGTVSLGVYGSVYVSGLTLDSAQQAIQRHLSAHLNDPRVYLDVLAYNSKVYYVVTDGGGAGEQVYRFPCTGSETVLDALAQINGLPSVSSKKDIWIARPAPPHLGYEQILDVDWDGIVRGGQTRTNYQVLPGDRIYVRADDLITFDTAVAKIISPFERVMGFVLLGHGTVRALQFGHRFTGNGGGGL
jgi:polysaccharide biosynthesis/export protein